MKGSLILQCMVVCLLPVMVVAQTKNEIANGRFTPTGKYIKTDSIKPPVTIKVDTVFKATHSPRKATLRSALIPGWGQVYNKQLWKLPLVYAVIGIPAGTYFYNNKWYKKTSYAYQLRIAKDSVNFDKIDPKLQVLTTQTLQFYRNEFRRSRDYSILYTLLAWGLNVVDATVSGHLKEFDVSDDLSLRINPVANPLNNTNGLSLVLAFKKPEHKVLEVK